MTTKLLWGINWIVIFLILYFFYSHGFNVYDEGWIINPAQRIVLGQIPYRDFHYIYTPGVAYYIAFVFKIFGESIFISRIATLVVAFSTIVIINKLFKLYTNNFFAYLISAGVFLAWGPSQINFAWPVIFAIFSGLLTCYLLIISLKKEDYIFWAGITTGITILFKQNFGLAILFNNLIFFLLFKEKLKLKSFFFHLSGTSIVIAVFFVYLSLNNALIPFFQDFYFFMFQQIIINGLQSTPFIYKDTLSREVAKTAFYLLPIIFGAVSIISYLKLKYSYKVKIKPSLILSTFVIFYYLLGIRPTTDYTHLIPLLSISGISLAFIFINLKSIKLKAFIFFLAVGLIVLGFYNAIFRNYYRWDTPLVNQNYKSQYSRVGIYTDKKYKLTISKLVSFTNSNTNASDSIFIYSFSPTFYLVLNRSNPTKYIFLPPRTKKDDYEIISDLRKYNVKIVFTDPNLSSDKSTLSKYIQKNYKQKVKITDTLIWGK